MISYRNFVNELRSCRAEIDSLLDMRDMHNDSRFRKWRHRLTELLKQIHDQGYPVSCDVASRQFGAYDPYVMSNPGRDALFTSYRRELTDTANELDLIVENYTKYGEPNRDLTIAPQKKPLEPKQKWASVKDHPIAVVTIAVIATVGIVWKVDSEIRVSPRDQRIADLEKQLAQEQAKNVPASQTAARHLVPKAPDRELPYKVYQVSDRRDKGIWLNALVNQLSQEGEAEHHKYKEYLLAWVEFAALPEPYKFKIRLSSASEIDITGLFAFRVRSAGAGPMYHELPITFEQKHRIVSVPETQPNDWLVLLVRLSAKHANLLPNLSEIGDSTQLTIKVLAL